jgi:PAS domain-containing protein
MNGAPGQTNGAYAATNGELRGAATGGSQAAPERRRTTAAWERFAAGEDAVRGVRPEILLSWYRCREEYKVNPHLTRAPPASEPASHTLEHDAVFAELGGLAATTMAEVDAQDGIVTVADCEGRVLAWWGDHETMRMAEESNLAPWSAWSEWASGTNGMGTALESHRPVLVQGPEHWCEGFHGWSCAGLAVRDVVTSEPLAVLNISVPHPKLSAESAGWLGSAAASVEASLRRRERGSGTELVAAFTRTGSHTSGPAAAVDTAGKVVIANAAAGALFGVPADTPATDPGQRWTTQIPELSSVASQAVQRARLDPQWSGSVRLFSPLTRTPLPMAIHPVLTGGRVIGMMLTAGGDAGDQLPASGVPDRPRSALRDRLIGRRGARLVLLTLHEIRFAESDGNTIWLATDQGRLQATVQGLDHLEQQLAHAGFQRVHRRFLVNLRRVREVEQGFKGALFLITDPRAHETVPVSRRHAAGLRRALGV